MQRAKPWLQGLSRRTLRDIDPISFSDAENFIYKLITAKTWPYKTRTEFYHARDKALMALCFLTMGRIHEVLKLTKRQFDFSSDPGFIVIHNYNVGKRKETTIRQFGKTYIDVPLSEKSRFTPLIVDHLNNIDIDDRLFPFSRYRAWTIIKHVTGLWCHWFRSQAQSFKVNKVGNPMIVSDIYKVSISTMAGYYKGEWKDHKDKLA